MKQVLLILLLCGVAGLWACNKKSGKENRPEPFCQVLEVPDEYLIFGTSYGMCAGDCIRLYQLNYHGLYEDSMESYLSTPDAYAFKKSPMSPVDYTTAKELETLPAYLAAHPDTSFGCPDCHDQGKIHLQQKKAGVVTNWSIDTDTSALPEELKAYTLRLLAVMKELE